MAGWNQFPNYNFPQGNGQMPMQTQAVMQNTFMPIEVRDEQEAKSYPMAAQQPPFFLFVEGA